MLTRTLRPQRDVVELLDSEGNTLAVVRLSQARGHDARVSFEAGPEIIIRSYKTEKEYRDASKENDND